MIPGLITPLDPLHGDGYQFWSGIGSDFGILTILLVFWRNHNCHEHKCWRLSWHPDAEGHPVCKVHHTDHPATSVFDRFRRFGTEGLR